MNFFDSLYIILILLPMVIGFMIKINDKKKINILNKISNLSLLLILFFIGFNFIQLEGLKNYLIQLLKVVCIFIVILSLFNFIFVIYLDKKYKVRDLLKSNVTSNNNKSQSYTASLKQVLSVLLGLFIGYFLKDYHLEIDINIYLLGILLFCIGAILRSNNFTFRMILGDKLGIELAIIFIISNIFAGIIIGIINHMPIMKSIALSSGYGWYSLSSVIFTEVYSSFFGVMALLIDFSREMIAVVLIPILIRLFPSFAISIGGATSIDFVLPVILNSGGVKLIPSVITFGIIVNLLSPLFMILFSSF